MIGVLGESFGLVAQLARHIERRSPAKKADAARYAYPARTPARNAHLRPAYLCPSRVASNLVTRCPTTPSGKQTDEEQNRAEQPDLHHAIEKRSTQENLILRRVTAPNLWLVRDSRG